MFRFYTPILILQAFCLYHAYSNNTEKKWYFIVIFFPVLGSLAYLFYHFYSRANIDHVAEVVKHAVVSNYKIEQLEKQLRFADTTSNKILLADEYAAVNRHEDALKLYSSCLNGIYKDDPVLLRKLTKTHFINKNYSQTINFGEQLKSETTFRNSEERIAYAWAFYYEKNIEKAEKIFKDMDVQFTNYKHRIAYAKFLLKLERNDGATSKLELLLEEIDHMDKYEKRLKRPIKMEVKEILSNIGSTK